jgi:hypothetical protein
VVRFGGHGRPQQLDGAIVAALLHLELGQVDTGAEVGRVELEHLREGRLGDVDLVLRLGEETEDVVRLRRVRRGRGGLLRGRRRGRRIGQVEQRNREVDPGQIERRIDRQRAAEAGGGLGVVVLLEQRDADVVGAVGILARGRAFSGAPGRRRRRLASRRRS